MGAEPDELLIDLDVSIYIIFSNGKDKI